MTKRLQVWLTGFGLMTATALVPSSAHAQGGAKPASPAPAAAPAAPAAPAAKPGTTPAPGAGGAMPATEEERKAEARTRFQNGLSLYDEGAFDAARVQLERAYALAPSYKILYNVGLVYKQLNEFVGALKAFEQYLAEGGSEVPEARRAEVTKYIESLKNIVASATVTVNVPGADITVDDATVGKSPLTTPVLINPGRRKIGAKLEGKLPDNKVITVAGGDKVNVDLKLTEAVVINEGTDVKPIIAWSVTGALAIGAGVTAFLAHNASEDREDLRSKRDATKADLDDALSKQHTLSLVSDILSVTTIVAAGVAVYFTWFHKSEKSSPDKPQSAPAATGFHLKPSLGRFAITF